MDFGQSIKEKREALGMTQKDLADRLFVSRQTVCRWENGTRCPDLIMSKKIAIILGISLDELVPNEAIVDHGVDKEPAIDISCVKVMLSGVMLLLVGIFLLTADDCNMDISAWCFFGGIGTFAVGLLMPQNGMKPIVDDALPQRKCPKCGKEHDFDYPQCPFCDYNYINNRQS